MDGRVHARAAARGHPVRGIPDQEYPPLPVPVGQLRRKGECADSVDPDRNPGHADSGRNQFGQTIR